MKEYMYHRNEVYFILSIRTLSLCKEIIPQKVSHYILVNTVRSENYKSQINFTYRVFNTTLDIFNSTLEFFNSTLEIFNSTLENYFTVLTCF